MGVLKPRPTLVNNLMTRPFHYGGQAIIEGVMMRGQENVALAIRCPDSELNKLTQPLPRIYKGTPSNIL